MSRILIGYDLSAAKKIEASQLFLNEPQIETEKLYLNIKSIYYF